MRLFAICLALAIATAACGTDQAIPVDAAPDVSLAATISATPNPTTIAAGGTVVVAVSTTNFKIISPQPAPKAGEGHYHYYLDDAVNYVAAWTSSVSVRVPSSAAPGAHMIRFVLVSSDHVEVNPLVETTVMFTVQ